MTTKHDVHTIPAEVRYRLLSIGSRLHRLEARLGAATDEIRQVRADVREIVGEDV